MIRNAFLSFKRRCWLPFDGKVNWQMFNQEKARREQTPGLLEQLLDGMRRVLPEHKSILATEAAQSIRSDEVIE
jgi:hypothetical protein